MHRPTLAFVSAAAALVLVAAACRDQVTTPRPATPRLSIAAPTGPLDQAAAVDGLVWSTDFTVSPAGSVYSDGLTTVSFPANSVCDPATSGYGTTSWNLPCTPISKPLTLHATVSMKAGHLSLVVKPDVRFVPTSDPAQMVVLGMRVPHGNASNGLRILWSPDGKQLVDEAAIDPTLATVVDRSAGLAVRRVKHFSCFTTWGSTSGFVDLPDGTCEAIPGK